MVNRKSVEPSHTSRDERQTTRLQEGDGVGVGRRGDGPRGRDVLLERFNRAETRARLVFAHHAQERQHGNSAVGNLLALKRLEISTLAPSQRVKLATRVHAVGTLRGAARGLGERHQQQVGTNDREQVGVGLHAHVLGGLFPRRRLRGDPRTLTGDFDADDAGDAHHRPAAVDELSLTVALQVFRLFTELERVKPIVAVLHAHKNRTRQSLLSLSRSRARISPPAQSSLSRPRHPRHASRFINTQTHTTGTNHQGTPDECSLRFINTTHTPLRQSTLKHPRDRHHHHHHHHHHRALSSRRARRTREPVIRRRTARGGVHLGRGARARGDGGGENAGVREHDALRVREWRRRRRPRRRPRRT